MIIIALITIVINVVLLILFIRMCMDVKRIKQSTAGLDASVAYYIEEANEYQKMECNREAKVCLHFALNYLNQGKIGLLSNEVLSEYQPGEDISLFLEKYITEKLW